MAGSKGDKYYDVFLEYEIWLKTIKDQVIMNEDCLMLLGQIKALGSIKLAAEKNKISYRKAWDIIEKSENILGFKLVEKQRGGKDGGHTGLSSDGENLVNAYNELKNDIDLSIKKITKKFFHKINLKEKEE
jgi:molybdate transport repressor ModE-like protein